MDRPGVLLDIEDAAPYDPSIVPYWNVVVGGRLSQWREDLIDLAS